MKKPSVFIIFLTVFVDLIGFGIVLPLLPIFAREFNANGLTIGLLMASYSAMQFFFAPVWGKFSDRVGRRPVLLMSTAAAAVSYAVFAVGSGMPGSAGLAVLFFSRIVAGICGANITVAQAYIADITPPEERSKKMGLIGMAFGLGFIFGPVLSGVGMHFFGMTGPGWIAASFCAANFLFALTRLPESWKPTSELATQRPRLTQWIHTLSLPKIGLLVGIFFLATFCFTCFETTLGLLVSQNFHLVIQQVNGFPVYDEKIVYLYAYCGIVGALVQGGDLARGNQRRGREREREREQPQVGGRLDVVLREPPPDRVSRIGRGRGELPDPLEQAEVGPRARAAWRASSARYSQPRCLTKIPPCHI
ncbi:MAG: hypothetical protein DME23_24800 [Verrucomicrobia bacterium]|nr:MAG: hypothetical protein DME23_24800 [Verrucomicrobiota bacterium]